MKRIKTGIEGLDEKLGDGLPEGSISIVSGPTGSGRTTFGLQFLVNGAEKENEVGLYICIEDSKNLIFKFTNFKGWDLELLEKEKKVVFLDYPPHEVDQFLSSNSAIGELIQKLGVQRLIIDSVMPIALIFSDEDERRKGFLKLIENIRKLGVTTLIIAQDSPQSTQDMLPRTIYGIESLSDGWIHLCYSQEKTTRNRYLEILKMKGTAHSIKRIPFEINDEGICLR